MSSFKIGDKVLLKAEQLSHVFDDISNDDVNMIKSYFGKVLTISRTKPAEEEGSNYYFLEDSKGYELGFEFYVRELISYVFDWDK